MEYDMPLYRPPSEAYSLILQVTLGCSHNECAFCLMYRSKRFRVRPFRDIERDVNECTEVVPDARRIFLADGDAMALNPKFMQRILRLLYKKFPRLERVTSYASPQNLLRKTPEDLRMIRDEGLDILYYGIETGDDELLPRINKGATHDEIVRGALRAQDAGFPLSVTVLLGLGGRKGSARHITETVRILNEIDPNYIGALTLLLPGELKDWYAKQMGPEWEWLNKIELLKEIRDIVDGLETTDSVFRSNHASNYLPLKGTLKGDRDKLLKLIDKALSDPRSPLLRPEEWRGL